MLYINSLKLPLFFLLQYSRKGLSFVGTPLRSTTEKCWSQKANPYLGFHIYVPWEHSWIVNFFFITTDSNWYRIHAVAVTQFPITI